MVTHTESSSASKSPDTGWENQFVDAVFSRCSNKGQAARLRRADNPATEYQSWEVLGSLGVDLEKDWQRLPFVTVAAAIARSKAESNGNLTLGKALIRCYDNDRDSDQAKARLRRLLACSEQAEVCRIIRPILALIQSKVDQPLNFVRLLTQLRQFHFNGQKVKAQWAQEFYGQRGADKQEESES